MVFHEVDSGLAKEEVDVPELDIPGLALPGSSDRRWMGRFARQPCQLTAPYRVRAKLGAKGYLPHSRSDWKPEGFALQNGFVGLDSRHHFDH